MNRVECSVCGQQFADDNKHGIKRHEEWHDPKNAHKHVSKNKVWGKVQWIMINEVRKHE